MGSGRDSLSQSNLVQDRDRLLEDPQPLPVLLAADPLPPALPLLSSHSLHGGAAEAERAP